MKNQSHAKESMSGPTEETWALYSESQADKEEVAIL